MKPIKVRFFHSIKCKSGAHPCHDLTVSAEVYPAPMPGELADVAVTDVTMGGHDVFSRGGESLDDPAVWDRILERAEEEAADWIRYSDPRIP